MNCTIRSRETCECRANTISFDARAHWAGRAESAGGGQAAYQTSQIRGRLNRPAHDSLAKDARLRQGTFCVWKLPCSSKIVANTAVRRYDAPPVFIVPAERAAHEQFLYNLRASAQSADANSLFYAARIISANCRPSCRYSAFGPLNSRLTSRPATSKIPIIWI